MAWYDNWMTASECADWWMGLIHQQTNNAYQGLQKNDLAANTKVGFVITWGMDSVEMATDLFVFDPLRLGQGSGAASAVEANWAWLQTSLEVSRSCRWGNSLN